MAIKKIVYSAQHNSKGKYHLIPHDQKFGNRELCHSSGTFLFTASSEVELTEWLFYEVYAHHKSEIPLWRVKLEYCKKCITKALKQYTELKKQ